MSIRTPFMNALRPLAFVTLCFTGLARAALGQVLYTATDLGDLGGGSSYGMGINSAGTVAGYSDVIGGDQIAFSYSAGTMSGLGTLGGSNSYAYAINAGGVIVGWAQDAGSNQQPFQDVSGTMSNLGLTLGSGTGIVYAVNTSGTFVGVDQNSHAFSQVAGVSTDLGTLGGNRSLATGINSAGTIVGWSDWTTSNNNTQHAFSYSGGTMTDLGTLDGSSFSQAEGVNDAGVVVGYSPAPSGFNHAVSFSGSTVTDLGTLGGAYIYSIGNAINNSGAAVGSSSMGGEGGDRNPVGGVGQLAVLYSNGQVTDLNTLVDLPGVTLANATAINDAGQIVANDVNGRTYLLTPIAAAAPAVATQTSSETVIAGQNASFSVAVTGVPAPTYQWQESTNGGTSWTPLADGAGISGSSTATLAITAAPAALSGDEFQLIATNGSGSATSTPATLTVTALPGGDLVAYDFTTLAGVAPGSADGTGPAAQFDQPWSVAVDAAGNIYVADSQNNTIRKVTSAGVVTTFAGAAGQRGSANGTGSVARFNNPQGVALDNAGNLYVGDSSNSTVRKITPAGVVTTLAGSPNQGGNADGTGGAAQFGYPQGVAVDVAGNVYVADTNNNTIRKITPAGVVTTLAGMAGQGGNSDGQGGAARFNQPFGVAVDGGGNVYVADTMNCTVRMITPMGLVSTLAGSPGQGGNMNGTGSAARFSNPSDVAVDSGGNVYVADTNSQMIREIAPGGVVTTLAGSGQQGSANGTGSVAQFNQPRGVAVDASLNVYVADGNNNTIRLVTQAGGVTTLAGAAVSVGSADGTGASARFFNTGGTAADNAGNVYVADIRNNTIRKITPAGVVTTLAGAAGQSGNADGAGASARFNQPWGVAVDSAGNLYVSDVGNETVRKITPSGFVSTLAGTPGQVGVTDGTGGAARFNNPQGVAVDGSGNVYVADSNNGSIRKIEPGGFVTTFAGTSNQYGYLDGTGAAARFNQPNGVAVDGAGNVYVADSWNDTIRKITTGGVVTTLAGAVGQNGGADGTGSTARFNNPRGVAVDAAGDVFVADMNNAEIRMITPAGVVTTLAGNPSEWGSTDGTGSAAHFTFPTGIAVDGAGNLYVGDENNNTVRKGTPSIVSPASITTQPMSSAVNAGESVSFTLATSGSTPFTYQWQMEAAGSSTWTNLTDGGEFSGTATASLSITGVTVDLDQAQFQCVITNGGMATSDAVTLTVNYPPAVVLQSGSETVVEGQSASFSAGVSGSPAPILEWQESTDGGNTWTDLTDGDGFMGTGTPTLGIIAVTTAQSGAQFRLAATNGSGSAPSTPATLTVTALQGGDLVAYAFTTLAGMAPGHADGTGAAAQFNQPNSVAVDGSGNVYVADSWNDTIRKVTTGGVVTTLAGAAGQSGSADGTGSLARFNNPRGVAADAAGDVFVADGSNTIRKVTPTGVVTTLAGSPYQNGNADGTGGAAQFNNPQGLAVDSAGNVYVADSNNGTIRKITPAGVVTTFAGSPNQFGSADGTGSAAQFNNPEGVAVDIAGNVYVADTNNNTIREITPLGVVTTLAGEAGQGGNNDGTGSAARFASPFSVAVDGAGNVYVADANDNAIRQVTSAGVVTTLAGMGPQGSADGTGGSAQFNQPHGVAVDASDNIYVADSNNSTIRRVTTAGVVTTLAGMAGQTGSADGTGSAARFYYPQGVAVDSAGNVYVADSNNQTIREITPAGVVTTLAGAAGQGGNNDGTGSAARFSNTRGVAVDSVGNVYVADQNNEIRKITPAGVVTTLAGGNHWGYADGTGSAAQFNNPQAVAVDGAGNVYVADTNNNLIRKITPAGVVTTLAGNPNQGGNSDGAGSAAQFNSPQGIAVDSAGNVYVADRNNNEIREITPAGMVSTLAGVSYQGGNVDGTGGAARFNNPAGVAIDGAGNLYVADTNNFTIRKVTQAGVVTTLGGAPNRTSGSDGFGSGARFNYPQGVAVDVAGNVYVADTNNSTIRKGAPTAVTPVSITAQPQNATTSAGQNASFTVGASGTTPIAYEWQMQLLGSSTWTELSDGGLFSGTATATLSITGATSAMDQAQFQCVASNGGMATSTPATLSVYYAPGMVLQSGGESVVEGQSVSFSVGFGGSPGPTYQWQMEASGSSTWTNLTDGNGISGSATATLTIDAAASAMNGDKFELVATNSSGTVTSTPVTLTVTPLSGGIVAYDFTTLAGMAPGSADGTGAAAQFDEPYGVAVDGSGNTYVADTFNDTIRMITPEGVVTTLAGAAGQSGATDGTGSLARFNQPRAVAADSAGNVYVADGTNTIRKVTPAGVVTTLAGAPYMYGSSDGTGGAAQFSNPQGVAVDVAGNVYVADSGNNEVRVITPAGMVTTLAGVPYAAGNVDGMGSAARFASPQGIAVDLGGNVYVADTQDQTIRMVTQAGGVTTLAGTPGQGGSQDGAGSAARFNNPRGVAVDGAGNVYVADSGSNTIRAITPSGVVTTPAGNPYQPGSVDGTGTAARFNNPYGVAVDASGLLYVADAGNGTIRQVTPAGVVTTFAGTAGQVGSADGTGSAARFNYPEDTAVDLAGNTYVADSNNGTIRKITPGGVVTTLAGAPNQFGYQDGTGSSARFSNTRAVAVDSTGNVYVADGNNMIRKVTPMGVVTTLAGMTQWGYADGPGNVAQFNNPMGIAVDGAGTVYVADTNNSLIRKITPAGVVTTLAGSLNQSGNQDGTGSGARFNGPQGIAVDGAGNVYVADRDNSEIREISPSGVVTTLAGMQNQGGLVDGTGSAARFGTPQGVAVDGAGNVYVADSYNNAIRKVAPGGIVTTLGGSGDQTGSADGLGTGALFNYPSGVAVDGAGNLYVADTNNSTIRMGVPTAVTPVSVTTQPQGTTVSAGQDATFTVGAIGSTPFAYQWQMQAFGSSTWTNLADGGAFSGTTTGMLTITGATADLNQAEFQCVITNGGTATSDAATLTVNFAPSVVLQSGNETVISGQSASFSAGFDGSPAPGYQWQESTNGGTAWTSLTDGNGISGSGTATLTIGAATQAMSGEQFQVLATNAAGSGTSAPATLTVTPLPGGNLVAYAFTTLAGFPPGSADGTGAAAQFNQPNGAAVDGAGNVYVADTLNCIIRKITPAGVVTTLAGAAGQNGATDGAGSLARFNNPRAVAVDSAYNVYVADGSNTIRKVTPAGAVTTLAGSANQGGNNNGTGGAAQFNNPQGVAVDSAGNVYVADSGNNEVRVITPAGMVTTLAGVPYAAGNVDGMGSAARFASPQGIAVDLGGNVYVADTNNVTIREITPGGVVTTLAGAPNQGGSQDGTGSQARFNNPQGVAVDSSGNVYVADTGSDILRVITPAGVVTTLAGSAYQQGSADGTGSVARFSQPHSLASTPSGTLYVADTYNDTIRMVTPAGAVTTLAGAAGQTGSADGAGSAARFLYPEGVAVDSAGTVYVADTNNGTIRKITHAGVVTTLAGAANQFGHWDAAGSAARFNNTRGVAVDLTGNLYVADGGNTIRKVTPSGVVTTLAGNPNQNGSADGAGGGAQFNNPQGVAVDAAGNVYVADTNNQTIRKITPSGVVTTLAGAVNQQGNSDGMGSGARFNYPQGLAVDGAGDVYVADRNNNEIREITPSGVVTTSTEDRFNNPQGVAVDGAGNIYVADTENDVIRMIAPGGFVTSLGGAPSQSGSADGLGAGARFRQPSGVAVDGAGNLYVADTNNSTIRTGVPMAVAPASITAQPQNATTAAGQNASFSVVAGGTAPFAYQWQMQTLGSSLWVVLADGGEFSGTATATLSITGATDDLNQAQFQCVVSNGGMATSNTATLTVDFPPGVSLQSGNETVVSGQSASFSVGFGGSPIPGLQWQESTNGGATWTNLTDGNGISGSTMATLTIASATAAMTQDEFQVVATNSAGTVTSAPVTLTVQALAGDDLLVYDFMTLAGLAPGSADGAGAAAQFNNPNGLAVDSSGNVYVADTNNQVIRMITPAGVVTTLAGAAGQSGFADGTGEGARFNFPSALAVDGAGNVYVADTNNEVIRMITPAGVVTTLAGQVGQQGYADGMGEAAQFRNPQGVAVDGAGNVYVADTNNSVIRMVSPAGVVTTLAGATDQGGWQDGTGGAALFSNPTGIAVDDAGNVYVADTNNQVIRKIAPGGVVTTLAGEAHQGGHADGTGLAARFGSPQGVAVDGLGNVYVVDTGSDTLRAITPAGAVTTLAGSAYSGGSADGTGSAARFNVPRGVASDASGNLYVADTNNGTIRAVTPAGAVTTLAGTPGQTGSADGTGSAARFNYPRGAAVDIAGNVFVADTNNLTIREITPAGVVTTLAGAANNGGYQNGTGTAARFQNPCGVAVDTMDNVYVADTNTHTIRKITAAGLVTTLAGIPYQQGSADGIGSVAQFNSPQGVAVDDAGNVFVADTNNATIRKITPAGVVSTLAGTANQYGNTNGTGSAAQFNNPRGVAVDGAGNVYVADSNNQEIRVITPAGVVTTLAGSGQYGSADGTGSTAQFEQPDGVAVDGAGNVYVADTNNSTIRMVTPAGVVTTLGGVPSETGGADGPGIGARFSSPGAIAVDVAGNLYVADTNNSAIRIGAPTLVTPPAVTLATPGNGVIGDQITLTGTNLNWATGVELNGVSAAFAVISGTDITVWVPAGAVSGPGPITIETAFGSFTSGTFSVNEPPTVTGGSPWQNVFAGETATFTVVAAAAVSYQWQESTDGIHWTTLSDGGAFSGSATATLAVTDVTSALNGDLFQAVVTNSYGSTTSTAAPLNLVVPPTATGITWGQTDNPAELPVFTPRAIAGGVTDVEEGGTHTMFLKADGSLWATGGNSNGQLGDGTTAGRSTPEQVASGVAMVSAGNTHTMFVKTDGTLWAMGSNNAGQLGTGNTMDSHTPVQVPGASGVIAVAAGNQSTLFFTAGGTLWAMGDDSEGELGDGGTSNQSSPVQVPGASGVTAVAASTYTNASFWVKSDGSLWAVGDNSSSELGDGSASNKASPEMVVASGVASVKSDGFTTLYLSTGGALFGTGQQVVGQLGRGVISNVLLASFTQIDSGVTGFAAGNGYTLYTKSGGSLWATGTNLAGTLCDAALPADVSTPVQVATGVARVAALNATLFTTADGTLWAAGDDTYGELGDSQSPIGAVEVSPNGIVEGVIGSQDSSIYLKNDGTVWLQSAENFSTPLVQLPGASGVVQVVSAAYNQRQLYLKSDGTLWQNFDYGVVNPAVQVASNVASVATGLDFFAYVTSDGTLWAEGGDGWAIQFGDGVHPVRLDDHVVSVASAGWYLMWIRSDDTVWGQGTAWDAGLGPNESYNQAIDSPIFLQSGTDFVYGNMGQILYTTPDGTLWSRGGGFGDPAGPSVVADTGATAATADGNELLYLKPDNVLRLRTGSQGTLGPVVDVAGGVVAVNGSNDLTGAYVFIQTIGSGTIPTIGTQPQSANVPASSSFTLQASATGSGPMGYLWYKDGVSIPWAQTAQYTIPYVTPADAGSYHVVATNSVGQATSATATLTVGPQVTVTAPWQTVFAGNNATFAVAAPTATGFQWQESTDGGTTWTDLSDGGAFSGSATATLTVSGVTSGMSGDLFRAVVTDPNGTSTAAAAALTVVAPPTATGITWGVSDSPTALPVFTPKAIAGGVVDVEEGGTHTVFLTADGTLWATGGNSNGQLGDGTTTNRSTPEPVASGVAAVSGGNAHTMFIKTDGTLWGMGANGSGQLGIGTTNDSWTPVQVPGLTGVTAVAAGESSTLFLTSDGTLWAMGDDSEGELGDGGTAQQDSPVVVAPGVAAIAAATYYNSSFWVTMDGALWGVGDNANGQLGDGGTTNRANPEKTVTSGVASVRSSGSSTVYLTTTGVLYAAGQNGSGQLGDGSTTNSYTPIWVANGVTGFAAGSAHTMFITTGGGLWAAGSNASGDLCDAGINGSVSAPVQVANGVTQVAGEPATLFLTADGTLWAAGDDTYGELGDGQQPVLATEVSPSGFVQALTNTGPNGLYLNDDGTVWQQTGGFSAPVVQVPGAIGAVQIADSAYSQRQLYLKGDGTLWQFTVGGVTGTPTQVASDVVSVGTGLDYFAYLKSDGTLWAQGGDGWAIQFGDGVDPVQLDDHVVSVAAAGWYLMWIKSDDTVWGQGTAWDAGLGPNESYTQSIDAPIFLQSGTDFVYGNMGQILYMTTDGKLWSRGGGFGDPAGPSVMVDTGAATATADGNEALYLKGNTLYLRTGSQGTLGPVVDVAGGVVAVNGANDLGGEYVFIQTNGYGAAPSITASPQSAVAQAGAPLTLQASADGSGPLAYQWYKNGAAVSWAQAAQYTIPYVTTADSGSYYVVVTNSAGQATSATATVSLSQPQGPSITTQPASLTVDQGASATFTVVATGNPAPTYQWYAGGVLIPGATSSSFTLTNVQPDNAGSYSVTVSNTIASIASNSATLTVDAAPVITTQPSPQTVNAGANVTFTVAATGNPAPTYQWSLNGAPIAGATGVSLILNNVTPSNAGNYTVTATNAVGSMGSDGAALTVNVGPAITSQPASQTVDTGGSATFSVVATGSPAPAYQWYVGGALIPNATSSSLTLAIVQAGNAGSYTVTVTNSLGGVTSRAATLTVDATPVITTQPASQTVPAGASVTFSVVATSNPAPTYQWSFNGTAISGATRASLTLSRVVLANAGSYTVAVRNVLGSMGSIPATLTVIGAPVITTQPASQTVDQGNNATFTVVATSTPPPAYQWYEGGVLIPNATSATFTLTGVQPGAAGSYTVVVTNSVGSVTSAAAVLTVDAAPTITAQPASQSVATGSNVTFSVVATGNPAPTYQWSLGGTPIAGATNATLVLSAVTPASAGIYAVTVTNTLGPVPSANAVLTVSAPPVILGQPASETVVEDGVATFTVAASGSPAPTFQWYVGGILIPGATSSAYTLTSVQPSAAGSYTVVVSNNVASVNSAAAVLTVDAPPAIATQPVSQVVVAGSTVTFSVVATGNPAPTYQWSLNGTPIAGAVYASLALYNVTAANDGTYTVTVTNALNSMTSAGATLAVNAGPAITTQPASQAVDEGGSVTFTVVASGTPVPAYQWYQGGVTIPGATSPTLTLTGVQPASAGAYTVTVSNTVASVTSKTATLSVEAAPVITTQPASQTVAAGSNVTFTVVATGTPSPTYQWSLGGTPIPSATRASLTLSKVSAANAGNYTVAVTNAKGSVTSLAAVLAINQLSAPVITTQPSSMEVPAGTNVTYSVVATGNPAPAYQWYFGGVLIPGATASTLTLDDVQPGAAGSYTVTVANSIATVASAVATLAVDAPPVITTQPASQSVAAGNNATFSVVAAATPAATYQWSFNDAPIAGATRTTLTLVNVKAANAGTYTVTVTNILGPTTSNGATLTVIAKPVIATQPLSQTVSAGSDVLLTVVATGTPVLTYQWSLGGAPLPGKTSSGLLLTDVQPGNAGNYTVTVTNGAGSTASRIAVLKVD